MLEPGFHDVPKGCVATVVTHLEMRSKPQLAEATAPDGISLHRITTPQVAWYRDLYARVGAQDWLWFSRLELPQEDLAAILTHPQVQVFALNENDTAQGLLELDFRIPGECELAFFGVTSQMIGKGLGRFLMTQAITHAWAQPIARFHVHTCTLDHPSALGFYRRSGFTPIRQQIEIAPDPRLTGLLPREAGAHIPVFDV